jgi:hypothetical protein
MKPNKFIIPSICFRPGDVLNINNSQQEIISLTIHWAKNDENVHIEFQLKDLQTLEFDDIMYEDLQTMVFGKFKKGV